MTEHMEDKLQHEYQRNIERELHLKYQRNIEHELQRKANQKMTDQGKKVHRSKEDEELRKYEELLGEDLLPVPEEIRFRERTMRECDLMCQKILRDCEEWQENIKKRALEEKRKRDEARKSGSK